MGSFSAMHWLVVVGVVVFMFGAPKAKQWFSMAAGGLRDLRKSMRDVEEPLAEATKEITDARNMAVNELTGLKDSMNRGL